MICCGVCGGWFDYCGVICGAGEEGLDLVFNAFNLVFISSNLVIICANIVLIIIDEIMSFN